LPNAAFSARAALPIRSARAGQTKTGGGWKMRTEAPLMVMRVFIDDEF